PPPIFYLSLHDALPISCGLAFLETAANPYVTVLGPKETAPNRLNFSQSFNGLAAFLAPIIGGKYILTETELSDSQIQALPVAEIDRKSTRLNSSHVSIS